MTIKLPELPWSARALPTRRWIQSRPRVALPRAQRVRQIWSRAPIRSPIRALPARTAMAAFVPTVILTAIAAAIGAALLFMFDPRLGSARRAYARDRVGGAMNRTRRRTGRLVRRTSSEVAGLRDRLVHANDEPQPIDEVTLVDRIESELFRDPAIDKGQININAEGDVVFLRGTAGSIEQISQMARRVERIEGVRRVVNLLHPRATDTSIQPDRAESISDREESLPG